MSSRNFPTVSGFTFLSMFCLLCSVGEEGGEEGVAATETTAPPLAVALAVEVDLEEMEGAFQLDRRMKKTGLRGSIALFSIEPLTACQQ